MTPKKPGNINALTARIIERIKNLPWAEKFVLGGGLALAHYLEFRPTNDADCWWEENTPETEKEAILEELSEIIKEEAGHMVNDAEISKRNWGETASIEVKAGNKKIFSWQISSRTKKLDAYIPSPYGILKIETLKDNLASKMCALVARGAPRDFLDIHTAIKHNLTSWENCWTLWKAKNPGKEQRLAEQNIAMSLTGIEIRRPLPSVPEEQRARAAELRSFFRNHLPALKEKEPNQP